MGYQKCGICGEPASYSCGACMAISYCSKLHQKEHWKTHKPDCAPYKISEDSSIGRHLIATRDIARGEVVLREMPLASGPPQITGPVCLGCHNVIADREAAIPCSLCGWPMCSERCQKSDAHKPECDWATAKRKAKVSISQFVNPHPTYGCITALRILYTRDNNPPKWSRIMSLESHNEEREKEHEKLESDRFSVAALLRRFYKLDKDFTEEEILKVCGIIQINSHEVPLSEPGYVSIYWHGSFLEHSCSANCSKSFSAIGQLVIRAAVDIKKGDHISICYTDGLWSTLARRHHLQQTKYFDCSCLRCQDVTEFGTYFSAIKCISKECKGKILPESFIDLSRSGNWRCNECGLDVTTDVVTSIISKYTQSALAVKEAGGFPEEILPKWRKYIDEAEEELPDTSQYPTEAGLALAQGLGQPHGLPSLLPLELSLKEKLLRRLLSLLETLVPGECRIRGILNFELHATLVERSRRESANMSPESLRNILLESRRCLEQTIDLLKYEPDPLPESHIYNQACENIRDLNALLISKHVDAII